MKKAVLSERRHSPQISIGAEVYDRSRKRPQIRKVLVPVDFSAPSLSAVQFALPLIAKFGASPHLVHVFPADSPFAGLVVMPFVLPEIEINRSVRRRLKDVAKKYSIELPRENIHALRGKPFNEICRLARDLNIDLIIIATRGNTGLKHLALGSTAERVVRYSPCPVLVVHGRVEAKKGDRTGKSRIGILPLRRILVPIDFSDCSMKGLAYARALAKEFGSTLLLLYSVHFDYYVASDEYARYDLPVLMGQMERTAKEQMRELVRQTDWDGLNVETAVEVGHAGQQICERAEDRHADLIVTSTHGETGLKHILLGSTAEYIVRHAQLPVVVVPSHERAGVNSIRTQT